MPRPYAVLGCSDLIALLAEHCNHPDAQAIAAEIDFRVGILGGLAQPDPMPDLEIMRPLVPGLLMGIPGGVKRPGPRRIMPPFACEVDESGGLAGDDARQS